LGSPTDHPAAEKEGIVMIILANGCSWTWGGYLSTVYPQLSERQADVATWPYLLAEKLGADRVVNLSQGCASNDRILRTTFDWLRQQTDDVLAETVIITQWTEASRWEFYWPRNSNDPWENLPERWAMIKAGASLIPDSHDRKLQKHTQTQTALHRDIQSVYTLLRSFWAMQQLSAQFKVPAWAWQIGPRFWQYPQEFRQNFRDSQRWLDCDQIWQYERFSDTDTHPSLQGHRDLSEIIHQALIDRWNS
jgi:hypothetical protein